MASEVYTLYIRILTPVHVGVDKSRDLTEGLDFKVKNGMLRIYDHKRLMEKVGDIQQYSNALEKGKTGVANLLKNRKIHVLDIQAKEYKISGNPGELNKQVCDGMFGHALLPGSSIKGALTSILFSYLYKKSDDDLNTVIGRRNRNNRIKPPQDHYLGKFEKSLNRFFHCSDVSFDRMAAFNAKIFNLHGNSTGNFQGGWKHEFRNTTTEKFQPTGFTFAFETIQPGFSAPFSLRFDKNMYERNVGRLPQHAQRFQNTADLQKELFSILYNHTSDYLEREIGFFNKFNQAEHSDKIMRSLEKLQEIHSKEAPVFRLASGSGFHSITGDWQFETHDINGINTRIRNRGQYNGKDSTKSRRFAFEQNEKGEFEFYPMGFVQIMTKDYYEKNVKSQEEEIRKREQEAQQKQKAEELRKVEDKKRAEEAAKAPQWIESSKLSKNKPKTIDAVVIGQRGKMMVVNPYVKGYENTKLEIRYPAGMEKGTVINIDVRFAGKSLQIQGYPKKK